MSVYSEDVKGGTVGDAPDDFGNRREPASNFIRYAPKLTGLALFTLSFQTLGASSNR